MTNRYGLFHTNRLPMKLLAIQFASTFMILAVLNILGASWFWLTAVVLSCAFASGILACLLAPRLPIFPSILALIAATAAFALPLNSWLYATRVAKGLYYLFSGIFATWIAATPLFQLFDYVSLEVLTMLYLLLFPFIAWGLQCVIAGIGAWDERNRKELAAVRGASLWTSYARSDMNNAAVANAAGWTAVLVSSATILSLNWLQWANDDWTFAHLRGIPWHLLVAPPIYLGYMLQRTPDAPPASSQPGVAADEDEEPALRPFYDDFSRDPLQAHVVAQLWSNKPTLEANEPLLRAQRLQRDLDALLNGSHLIRHGAMDASLFRLVSEAMNRVQDAGRATLILCPDGCGDKVKKQLGKFARFEFPEIVRTLTVWRRDQQGKLAYDLMKILDVVVAEETAFREVVVKHRRGALDEAYMERLLNRVGLIVFLDFHAVDASQLLLTLHDVEANQFPDDLGILVQSLPRQELGNQILTLRSRLSKRIATIDPLQTTQPTFEGGKLWLAGSMQFRQNYLNYAGYHGANYRFSNEAYLALRIRPAEETPPIGVFLLHDGGKLPRVEALGTEILAQLGLGGEVLRKFETGSAYLPSRDIRLLAMADRGNVFDVLRPDHAFWAGAKDYLTIVVSDGYPGMKYLQSQFQAGDCEHLLPLAQDPGVGIVEVVNRLSELLSRPQGASEEEVRRVLNLASGKILNYINISATKRGLDALFGLVSPGQPKMVDVDLDATQNSIFRQISGGGMRLAEPRAPIHNAAFQRLAWAWIGDYGLLFSTGEEYWSGSTRMKITSIAPAGNAVIAQQLDPGAFGPLDSGPAFRYYYRRDYALLIKENGGDRSTTLNFVGENERAPRTNFGLTCHCGHIYVAIERTSTRFIKLSTDSEPQALIASKGGPGVSSGPLATPINQRRPFRGVAIIAFEDRDGTFQGDPVLGATLAASLQVVLGLAFPVVAKRIAVVSLESPVHTAWESHEIFGCLYPRGRLVGATTADILARLYGVGLRPDESDSAAPKGRLISFAVIEDAAHDLGVARRINANLSDVIDRWRLFLQWAKDDADWNVNDVLNAKAAAAFPGLTRIGD